MNKYSITSNEIKLFKHLGNLETFQEERGRPIMIVVSPTNKCNLNCAHCCFSERDKNLELDFDFLCDSLKQFRSLGIKSVELAGGGEPALYPRINDLTDFISDNLNLDIGINTNGLNLHKIHLYRFKWIRLSLNFIDNVLFLESPDFSKRIEILRPQINNLTACYIVPKKIGTINLQKVVDFAEKNRIFTRIAPDCIQTKDEIKVMIDKINKELPKSEYCFCSDFNVFLQERPENFCAMQYIKPLLFTDGWVYPCPSFELAIENGTNVRKDFRLCYGTGVYEYYKREFEILKHTCSYCKYAKQNEILCNLLKETEFNNFV